MAELTDQYLEAQGQSNLWKVPREIAGKRMEDKGHSSASGNEVKQVLRYLWVPGGGSKRLSLQK